MYTCTYMYVIKDGHDSSSHCTRTQLSRPDRRIMPECYRITGLEGGGGRHGGKGREGKELSRTTYIAMLPV